MVLGELGLGGEVRRVRRLEQRLQEARQLGIEGTVVPSAQATVAWASGLRCHAVRTLADALALLV